MWFGKAADDFNQSIQGQGTNGPQLIAYTGNAFTSETLNYYSNIMLKVDDICQWFGWRMHSLPYLLLFHWPNSTFLHQEKTDDLLGSALAYTAHGGKVVCWWVLRKWRRKFIDVYVWGHGHHYIFFYI
jgi:hypothetical protein